MYVAKWTKRYLILAISKMDLWSNFLELLNLGLCLTIVFCFSRCSQWFYQIHCLTVISVHFENSFPYDWMRRTRLFPHKHIRTRLKFKPKYEMQSLDDLLNSQNQKNGHLLNQAVTNIMVRMYDDLWRNSNVIYKRTK